MRLICLAIVLALAGCVESSPAAAVEEPTRPTAGNTPFDGPLTAFGDSYGFGMPGGGQGIWIHNDVLYWTNGADLVLADVSDPLDVRQLGSLDGVGARDVDVLEWQNRTYAVLAGSGRGMHIVDVTNAPELVTPVDMPSAGVHNLAAVPGTPYIYSSGASGQEKRIDVVDITDPQNPVVTFFPIPATMGGVPVESDGCHDISVRSDLDRAYCAGGGGTYAGAGGETFIWDISDPRDPRWISMLDDPRIKYHHQALVNDAGDILIVNDEHIVANNCVRHDTPLPGDLDPQIPTGAAWVWDISDEESPQMRAIVQNPQTLSNDETPMPNVNCGSHFGDMVLGQEAFVMGWYTGGTILVSFEDPANPEILDIQAADSSHWDTRYWKGYVYHAGSDLVVTPLV